MQRRRYLALVGASTSAGVGALAGCIGHSPGDGETVTPTETATRTPSPAPRRVPMGRSLTVGDTRLTVGNPRVRKGVFGIGMHDPRVEATAGQFVVADVTVDGRSPDRLDEVTVASVAGGSVLPGGEGVATIHDGVFAFPFPAEHHDSAAIGWQTEKRTVYWTLPGTVRDALAAEPTFRIDGFALPRRDGELLLELTVANDGDRDGRFIAEVSILNFSRNGTIEFPVPAGGSRTYRGRAGKIMLYFENDGDGTLTVQYPGDDGVARLERTRDVSDPTPESNN